MTYPRHLDHPLLRGIDAEGRDLCWWRGDHFVARSLLRKPVSGNFRVLTEAGGKGGLRWSPLLEMPDGAGSWIFCQYLVDEKAADEPTCRRLLANLLGDASLPTSSHRTAVLTGTDYAGYLASLGLRADVLPPNGALPDLAAWNANARFRVRRAALRPRHRPESRAGYFQWYSTCHTFVRVEVSSGSQAFSPISARVAVPPMPARQPCVWRQR